MKRILLLAFFLAPLLHRSSFGVQQLLSESFASPTLDSRLSAYVSGSSYEISPFTPGATWELTKSAGETSGFAEIRTDFDVFGTFTIECKIDRTNLGTGEVGVRLGRFGDLQVHELYLYNDNEVRTRHYYTGGYGVAGIETLADVVTLRIARNSNNRVTYSANGTQFAASVDTVGNFPITIFLRPWTGFGGGETGLGKPDAHVAVLDQFSLVADGFVPEPASAALLLIGIGATFLVGRRS
jgi:hypothetical protein